jgi:hypothetical protein
MSRAIWFAAGAGLGVYGVVKARRVAEAFTADGIRDRLAGLAVGAHLFGEEVQSGMAEKENEVRGRLGPAHGSGPDQLDRPRLGAWPVTPGEDAR